MNCLGTEKQDEGNNFQMASAQAHFTTNRQANSAEKTIEDIISVSSSTCGSPVMVNKNDGRISTQPQGRKESCEIIDIDEGGKESWRFCFSNCIHILIYSVMIGRE